MFPIRNRFENAVQDFGRRLGCVHQLHAVSIMFEHRLGLGFVSRKAAFDDFLIGVIKAIVFQGAFFQPGEKGIAIRAGKMKDLFHIDQFIHDLGLTDVARNAIKDEHIDVGLELVGIDRGIYPGLPKLYRDVIGDELAPAGIFEEGTPNSGARVDRAKNVAASAMKKAWNRAKRTTLGALASARRAKEKISGVFHRE